LAGKLSPVARVWVNQRLSAPTACLVGTNKDEKDKSAWAYGSAEAMCVRWTE